MRFTQVNIGRTFGIAFDEGEDFLPQLVTFCAEHGIRAGYLPMFLGGFRRVRLVGTCERIENPDAPVWSAAEYETVEAFGCGTIAWDEEANALAPHIHVAVGLKGQAADGKTSHLLAGTVQFIHELLLVEVLEPAMTRPKLGAHRVPTLQFGPPLASA
ncbi:PPC domain-containing DNA-binding protein [Embleya sp. NPDC001921]